MEALATFKYSLKSDTGYEAEGSHPNVTPDQYELVMAALHADASNAKTMLAAFDLLAALESLMDLESRGRVMPIGREWDDARTAIAKARGQA